MLTPADRVVVYARPGCHVCARVKAYLAEHEVPYDVRDVDADPLTPRELWDLFNRKAGRLRVPFTALNDGQDVVLGYDPLRLEGVFVHGELGGVQVSEPVAAAEEYDDWRGRSLDPARWVPLPGGDRTGHTTEVAGGELRLRVTGTAADGEVDREVGREVGYVSTRRFATPPGSTVNFEVPLTAFPAATVAGGDGGRPGPARVLSGVRDLPTGMALGFEVTGDAVLAVHERVRRAGVTAEHEQFAHRVLTDVRTTPGQAHRYRISYRHETSQARWYVDDREVFTATAPMSMEGVSLSWGARRGAGPDVTASWGPWRITA